ncbi:MAG: hypothetical protein E7373_03505 [Clostridiales bacterium]|nr:hypothetical protein [Clostridiales bacterium]
MTNNKKYILKTFFVLSFICFICSFNCGYVFADALSDSIKEQLGNINLNELELFINSLNLSFVKDDFISTINSILNGNFTLDITSIGNVAKEIFLKDMYNLLPTIISIIAIAVLCGLITNLKSSYMTDSVAETIIFVCLCSIVFILLTEILSIYTLVKNTIETIGKTVEIMSPIMLTLMLAVGGNVSANVYKPAVAFLSGGIINLMSTIVLPLIIISTAFSVVSCFSNTIKLNKFSDFFHSIIKWIFGIIITIFTFFIGVQGVAGAKYDGITFKIAKYAISNSVPIVGGLLKDGLNIVIAGSVLIKNSIGVVVLFSLFFLILKPVFHFAVFSTLLKLTSALIEPICDVRICNFCLTIDKTISFLTASILVVGFLTLITVALMTASASVII